ncbi:hypothetical protein LA080_004192 [Diaporthe eres]|nr:hypothetical protein LA080_004192 [Diaporthe eres]
MICHSPDRAALLRAVTVHLFQATKVRSQVLSRGDTGLNVRAYLAQKLLVDLDDDVPSSGFIVISIPDSMCQDRGKHCTPALD